MLTGQEIQTVVKPFLDEYRTSLITKIELRCKRVVPDFSDQNARVI